MLFTTKRPRMKWILPILLFGVLLGLAKDIHVINDLPSGGVTVFPSLSQWNVLAPFPTASREQGADPLQAYGGIFNIPIGDNSSYPSDLINGGFVSWTAVTSSVPNGVVTIAFNTTTQVNWPLIEDWAGAAGSMWQGWAVAEFTLDQDSGVLVTCLGPGTIYVDSRLINGDKYSTGYATTPLYLTTGKHMIYVLIIGYETGQFQCILNPINTTSAITVLNDVIVPDVVEGALASPYFSVTVMNNLPNSIENVQVTFVNSSYGEFEVEQQWYPTLQAAQTLPISFALKATSSSIVCGSSNTLTIFVQFSSTTVSFSYTQSLVLACKLFNQSYTFSFLDFDNSVQYAAARAPVNTCPTTGCPVLLTLHGAGVDAATGAWTYAYYQQNFTWLLFPTNRRPYGWDWQGPGLQNAIQTLEYFAANLPGVPEEQQKLYAANPNLVIYAGHSMGGHGCWTISTHYPDRAIAVLPAAGWISMALYFPSFLRLGNSLSDPWVQMLMTAAVADYNDDFYTPHLVGIPLMIRMGSDDDNVPPYHLRRMARIVDELSKNPHTVQVSEIPGQGHWFNGVVDDPVLQKFFNAHYSLTLPPLPANFTVVTLNPATSGSKGGIQILQLSIPYRAGRIQVQQLADGTWELTTENIRRFGFVELQQTHPTSITVNGGAPLAYQTVPTAHYCLLTTSWQVCADGGAWEQTERGPSNYGPLEQVLRGPLTIVYGTQDYLADQRLDLAIYMANSLYYQARYAIQILSDADALTSDSTINNVILIGGTSSNSYAQAISSRFPVKFSASAFQIGPRSFSSAATGISFLAPFTTKTGSSLCAVLEGTDSAGLLKAVQLFPLLSTITTPDYAVAGPQWGTNGGAGLLALGFWNNSWLFDPLVGYITAL